MKSLELDGSAEGGLGSVDGEGRGFSIQKPTAAPSFR
jgi:hypothetical protein